MQDSWLAAKADEIHKYADTHDSKRFYDALKVVYGPQPSSTSSLLNVDGRTFITDKHAIRNRLAEHFSPADIKAETIARLPQHAINTDLDRQPNDEEVKKAIKQLSTGKAPGADAIPAEVHNHGGDTLLQKLTDLSLLAIEGKILARVLLNRLIVHLEKGLLPESQCGFRGGRGTVAMIFTVRKRQGKCQE